MPYCFHAHNPHSGGTDRQGAEKRRPPLGRVRPYRIKPASLGGVMPGFDLDKALHLADALDDREIARKLALRK